MSERWLGLDVGAEEIKVVDAEVPDDANAPIVIHSDLTWPIQGGDRSKAYDVMYRQVANYAKENGISRAVVKDSATGGPGATMKAGHLRAAELRGVAACALASVTDVKTLAKAKVSKTFGKRKADEYVKDGEFWKTAATGDLRKGSRQAALMILAARKADA